MSSELKITETSGNLFSFSWCLPARTETANSKALVRGRVLGFHLDGLGA